MNLSEKSDEELVVLCQNEDENAMSELYRRYWGVVSASLWDDIRNESANDVTQEVFIRVWQKIGKFKGDSKFQTWLFRIVQNAKIDYFRRVYTKASFKFVEPDLDNLESEICSDAPTVPYRSIVSDIERHEELALKMQKINKAFESLSPKYKDVLVKKNVDGLTFQEIADAEGIPLNTALSRHHYAKHKVRNHPALKNICQT